VTVKRRDVDRAIAAAPTEAGYRRETGARGVFAHRGAAVLADVLELNAIFVAKRVFEQRNVGPLSNGACPIEINRSGPAAHGAALER